ncbi:IS3 family transposase [Flavobacterium humidisoli]|uniref:IS3 family transposase n=1 Tax=Flavobacterium humidisoli TaxID=2937442 RepID=UPI003B8476CB
MPGQPTETQKLCENLKKEISSIFSASKQTYGSSRIAEELQKAGYLISYTAVFEHMRELVIYVSIKKNTPAVKNQANNTTKND